MALVLARRDCSSSANGGGARRSIDQGLRSRADDLSALAATAEARRLRRNRLSEREERFAQVIARDADRLVAQIVDRPILTPAEHARGRTGTFIVNHSLRATTSPRLLATPVATATGT